MLQRLQWKCSNQYKVNTYHYINYQDYVCTCSPVFSLSIIIDSRVKIIDNERPGASPCDSRGHLHANNTKSIVLYNIRLHIPFSYFTFSLGFFHFFFYSQSQVIQFTSCLPMVGGSLRLLPPLKLIAMI